MNSHFFTENTLFSASADKVLKVWDVMTGKELFPELKEKENLTALCAAKDQKMIYIGTDAGHIKSLTWDGKLVTKTVFTTTSQITRLVVSGQNLFIGDYDGSITVREYIFGVMIRYMTSWQIKFCTKN
jgi:WD40 repeat protein